MKQLTLSTKLWIYMAVITAAILYLVYNFYSKEFVEFKEQSDTLDFQIQNKNLDLVRIRTQNQRKASLEKEIAEADKELKKHQEMFPDQDFIPLRLQDLTKVTRQASVQPVSFKPQASTQREFYMENSYQIKLKATFHSLGIFFEEIANLRYPTGISAMTLQATPPEQDKAQHSPYSLQAQFQLITFTSRK